MSLLYAVKRLETKSFFIIHVKLVNKECQLGGFTIYCIHIAKFCLIVGKLLPPSCVRSDEKVEIEISCVWRWLNLHGQILRLM